MPGVHLDMRGISMAFAGVRAVDAVSFSVGPGEVHALLGENGAGKSTLMRVLGGAIPWPAWSGEVRLDDQPVRFRSVREARAAGIATVYQELSLIPTLSVGENLVLGREPHRGGLIDRAAARRRARAALERLGIELDPDRLVARLGIGEQQLVEVARALSEDARLLVLDEPTAALAEPEARRLRRLVRELRDRGTSIVYISHRLEEVFALADRITVLRDGRVAWSGPAADLDERRAVAVMVGREITTLYTRTRRPPGPVALEVRDLSLRHPARPGRPVLDRLSLTVRAGEIVGLAGLVGAGRTELLTSIFGRAPGSWTGEIHVGGQGLRPRDPADAIAAGIALVSEDRKHEGLLLDHTVTGNLVLPTLRALARGPLTDPAAERRVAEQTLAQLRIRAASADAPVATLSGGNQQKVVLGKWLLARPRVLLLDEPTRGVDVGARDEIYRLVDRLAGDGVAVLLASSDLPEVLGLADRILVLARGRLAAEFRHDEATPERVVAAALPSGS